MNHMHRLLTAAHSSSALAACASRRVVSAVMLLAAATGSARGKRAATAAPLNIILYAIWVIIWRYRCAAHWLRYGCDIYDTAGGMQLC